MRHEPNLRIENFRIRQLPWTSEPGKNYGAFLYKGLQIISSGFADEHNAWAKGWEHVSVSRPDRCPTWEEMCKVKEMFWRDDETVIQFHPRKDKNINNHEYCLHLWKLASSEFLLPPDELIGINTFV